jgi:hypothetical protein
MRSRSLAFAVVAAALWCVSSSGRAAAPRFYPDDPIARDPETQDASAAQPTRLSDAYDLMENSFLGAGEKEPKRAININTIDEVPDSSWFTNRAGARALSLDELTRGPDRGNGPVGRWTITGRKSEGVTPGFTIRDDAGDVYWIKFDPRTNPEMASGAEVISTKLFHAFGYHVPENYLAALRRDRLAIAPDATMKDRDGRAQPLRWRDVEDVLQMAAQQEDGTYRVLASRNLPGQPIGPFRYYGTRPDDPNDIFPHEHRRELRGLSVFAAWLNHDEVRSTNSLDTLVHDGGRAVVRHHLLDFGSTLGSGSVQAQSRRAGNEFIWEARPTLITMLTLGFYVRPWIKVYYPDVPAVGRIEFSYFQPEGWKPDYPNPAFRNARADDRFWAANIAAAIPDDGVRAVVKEARYTDPLATEYLTETLLARRHKVLKAWLNGVNPLVRPAFGDDGVLTFENAAERARVATPAERYTIEWMRFDNGSDTAESAGPAQTVTAPRAQAPASLLSGNPEFVAVRIRAHHPEQPAWAQPVTLHFRRVERTWRLVGLERMP